MTSASVFSPRNSPVKELHIVWLTAGLSCDGDSVSLTAAEQPSIEDVLLGNIPGLPKVHLHNPVLAPEVGDDFMKYFYMAEAGELDPFVLVVACTMPGFPDKFMPYGSPKDVTAINPDDMKPILLEMPSIPPA